MIAFDRWTKKSGVWHVEPPIDLLRGMMFARIHLDDANEKNGCLELALGTHHHGLAKGNDAADLAQAGPTEICRARRGDVLFVKALVVHRSGTSRQMLIDERCASITPPLNCPKLWSGLCNLSSLPEKRACKEGIERCQSQASESARLRRQQGQSFFRRLLSSMVFVFQVPSSAAFASIDKVRQRLGGCRRASLTNRSMGLNPSEPK